MHIKCRPILLYISHLPMEDSSRGKDNAFIRILLVTGTNTASSAELC